jgi:hypothetical protein
MEGAPQEMRQRSNVGILIGVHLGAVAPSGRIPTADGNMSDLNNVSQGGIGAGLDGGLRFARHWYAGLTYDHTAFAPTTTNPQLTSAQSHSDTIGLDFAFIVNPDRVSFYGTLGLQTRIYTLSAGTIATETYTSGEVLAGAGIWIPIGHRVRLLPELTGGFGSFGVPSNVSASASNTSGFGETGHGFFTLGLVGYYNIDL